MADFGDDRRPAGRGGAAPARFPSPVAASAFSGVWRERRSVPIAPAAAPAPDSMGVVLVAGGRELFAVEQTGLGIAMLAARPGGADVLAARVATFCGASLADGPTAVASGNTTFVGVGRGRWLALRGGAGGAFARDLAAAVAGVGSVTDQSGGYGVLRLSGRYVRAVLSALLPIDLHPQAFPPGKAVATIAEHMSIFLWRTAFGPAHYPRSLAADAEEEMVASPPDGVPPAGRTREARQDPLPPTQEETGRAPGTVASGMGGEPPTFDIAVPRSYAADFWHALETAAAGAPEPPVAHAVLSASARG